MKLTKKLFALLLALALCLSLGVCALAAEEDAETVDAISAVTSFTKTYVTAGGSGLVAAPAETLSFTVKSTGYPEKFTGDADALLAVGDGNTFEVDGETDIYTIPLTFNGGSTEGLAVGLYYFTVTENDGSSQGTAYGTGNAGSILYVTVLVEHSADDYETLIASIYLTDSTYTTKYEGLENTYTLGSLTMIKTVSGNLSDASDVFLVDVTFSSDLPVNSAITYDGAEATDTTAASGTVTLTADAAGGYTAAVTIAVTNDSEVLFSDIPAGVTYTVQEQDYTQSDINDANDGYDSPVYTVDADSVVTGSGAAQVVSGAIEAGDEDTVAIENTKGIEVKTGVSLESLPYILVLAAVVVVAAVLIIRKRRVED
ncbi:MAG: DUF5979 domain-containing protein [Oscillospiraceae bacterium]|nr:DUF5979 domain-containing protein [Oscillospiraceae bacterium]